MEGNYRISQAAAAKDSEIGIVIGTHNRPFYAWRTFQCMKKTLSPDSAALVVVDDASTSRMMPGLIRGFANSGLRVTSIFRQSDSGFGIHDSLRVGWDYLLDKHSPRYLCNVDSDVVAKPGWLERIRDLFVQQREQLGPLMATGFNAMNHPVLEEHGDHYLKQSAGGLNMFFDVEFYREIVRPNLSYDKEERVGWDWNVINAMTEKGYPVICTKPSVLQHIGLFGKFSKPFQYDRALDF